MNTAATTQPRTTETRTTQTRTTETSLTGTSASRRVADPLAWLADDATARRGAGLHRDLLVRQADSPLINLASNDYLGLSAHPDVIAAAAHAAVTRGAGATASRLVAGTTGLHQDFEHDIAGFLGFEAALCFSSGYLANIGAVTALTGADDLIVSDTGTHASLIDGCRLSRARVVVVQRGDVDAVRRVLAGNEFRRALVVSDSVYSIDGAPAPVADLYDVASSAGAALLVDEAHALGVCGPGGRGLIAQAGLSGAPGLVVTTVMSKSLGAQGGVVVGSEAVREHLIDCARPFIFDTGLNPPAVGAARAALGILRSDPALPQQLRDNAIRLAARCGGEEPAAAVVSLIIGDPHRAVAVATRCREQGVLVGCFRPPSVPAGTSRLRITARADLDGPTIDRVADVVNRARAQEERR